MTTSQDKRCGAPHPVPETHWTCCLEKGHDGHHRAKPPTITPEEILTAPDLHSGTEWGDKRASLEDVYATFMEHIGHLSNSSHGQG